MKRILTSVFLLVILSPIAWAGGMRIVSLKPAITDVVVSLGHGDRLVGVTKYCDASGLKAKPAIIGDYTRPHIERIIALRPDLVLTSKENSSRKSIERLQDTGIRVALFPFGTVDEMIQSTMEIGEAIGDSASAEKLASKMKSDLQRIADRWAAGPKVDVMIIWGKRPIVVAGRSSYMNALLGIIGAQNAAKGFKASYPRLGIEELVAIDPGAIIDLSMGSESDAGGGQWNGITSLKAVREKRVFVMDANDFRIGPRMIVGLEKLARLLHEQKD